MSPDFTCRDLRPVLVLQNTSRWFARENSRIPVLCAVAGRGRRMLKEDITPFLAVASGGFIGAVLRYLVDTSVVDSLPGADKPAGGNGKEGRDVFF